MRILIVAADPELSRWLHLTLSEWGYEAVAVNNGDEAWQKLQAEAAPPLVILDRAMPGLDSLELCRRVRQTSALPPSYIILLTEIGEQAEIEAGLAAGADDFLTKPCTAQELRARLQVGARVAWLQSELAQRDKHLEESEGRYTALFKNNHAATLLLDPATGDIVDANLAACNFYGYSHADLTRMKISDINELSPEQVFQVMQEVGPPKKLPLQISPGQWRHCGCRGFYRPH
jgi:CheY-like chemotaxis protein